MSNDELDRIGSEVCALRFSQDHADARKLLRSIEIAALREVLESLDKISTDPERAGWRVVEDVASARKTLEQNLRALALK